MAQPKTIRYASSAKLLGWPLLAVACGPDLARGESRGWARGIIAIGDVATGVIAIGGIAGGGFAVGGISCGGLSIGGVSLGGVILGGVAIGFIAFGGVAIGHYAKGGVAIGTHVVSPKQRDPEAVRLFDSLTPGGSRPANKEDRKAEVEKDDSTAAADENSAPADAIEPERR